MNCYVARVRNFCVFSLSPWISESSTQRKTSQKHPYKCPLDSHTSFESKVEVLNVVNN